MHVFISSDYLTFCFIYLFDVCLSMLTLGIIVIFLGLIEVSTPKTERQLHP